MNKNTRILIGNILLCVAMTALLLATVIPVLSNQWPSWQRYVMAAGAVGTLVAQILIPSPSEELRIRRLSRMYVWSAIFYCVAAYCLFSSNADMKQSWVAFLLAGAVIQIFAMLMISKLMRKKKE